MRQECWVCKIATGYSNFEHRLCHSLHFYEGWSLVTAALHERSSYKECSILWWEGVGRSVEMNWQCCDCGSVNTHTNTHTHIHTPHIHTHTHTTHQNMPTLITNTTYTHTHTHTTHITTCPHSSQTHTHTHECNVQYMTWNLFKADHWPEFSREEFVNWVLKCCRTAISLF